MAVSKTGAEKSTTLVVDAAENHVVQHLEGKTSSNEVLPRQLPPVKQLTFLECIKTYRYASLICVLAAVGALSDGYQVQMSGSVVALQGFIRTFGSPNDAGRYVIHPQHLALWGCEYYSLFRVHKDFKLIITCLTAMKNVAAMFGAFIGSYPADKLGRTWLILFVQIIMVGGCVLEQLATHWTHWLGARLLDVSTKGLSLRCLERLN
jgi:hypothetical protein